MVRFRPLASWLNVCRPISQVALERIGNVQLRELLTRGRNFALRSPCNEFLLFRLGLAPIASSER